MRLASIEWERADGISRSSSAASLSNRSSRIRQKWKSKRCAVYVNTFKNIASSDLQQVGHHMSHLYMCDIRRNLTSATERESERESARACVCVCVYLYTYHVHLRTYHRCAHGWVIIDD